MRYESSDVDGLPRVRSVGGMRARFRFEMCLTTEFDSWEISGRRWTTGVTKPRCRPMASATQERAYICKGWATMQQGQASVL